VIVSPLRYPGGKAKLYQFFVELLKHNALLGTEYCEPYAGGAGLALRLLIGGVVNNIAINDIDPAIYSFWVSVLFDTQNFCDRIYNTAITIEEWHRQKEVWSTGIAAGVLNLGFSTFFLNRTNRSGIIEGAGPIGGYAQSGLWKIDVRLDKESQIRNILQLARFSNQISVSNIDAIKFIENRISAKDTITYLDPPYYIKGRKLYKNFYNHEDHIKIADFLMRRRNSKLVVSYDDVIQIRNAYGAFRPISYLLNYSAGDKTVGSEVMYLSDALKPPEMSGFNIEAA
jgi:DNA adenine methylase